MPATASGLLAPVPPRPAPDQPGRDITAAAAGPAAATPAGLAGLIAGCRACPDLAAGRHRVVPGEFPDGAELLLVGEAPGRDEDEQGQPFVGRAGRLLDVLLDEAGIDRGRVAVTNVLKCRPPGNRAPTRPEAARCRGWLDRQVDLAAPLLVVTLGGSAAAWAFGRPVRLAEVRGGDHLLGPVQLIPTYHPSAALRFGPAGPIHAGLAADLRRARRRLAELAAGDLAIGPAGPQVAAELHALTRAAFAGRPPTEPPSGVFTETVADVAQQLAGFPAVVAYRHRRLAGGLRLAMRDGVPWLRRVAVAPAEHHTGVARALTAWVHRWAAANGHPETRLGVRSQLADNQEFWRSLGYQPVADHGFWIEFARPLDPA